MKTRIFEVPVDIISAFFEVLSGLALHIELLGVNEDQQLVVEVSYTDDDKEEMMDLIEAFDELQKNVEQEEEIDAEDDGEEEDEEEPELKSKRKTKSSRR